MATAIAAGSLLAAGGSAAAGAGLISATAFTVGSTAVSFSALSAGLGLAGQAFSIFSGASAGADAFDASIAASRAALEEGRVRAAETDLEVQRERTQEAIEDAERQRKLRRTLAAQRAAFAGGSVDIFSGSPVTIQEATAGQINREERLAEFASQDRIGSLNRQATGQRAAGIGKAASLIGKANTSLIGSQQNTLQQGIKLGKGIQDLGKLI